MSEFIRVYGQLPGEEEGKTGRFLLHRASIKTIQPVWGVRDDKGQVWSCTPGFKGAEVVSLKLTDFQGCKYSTGDVGEWRKLLGDEQIDQLLGLPASDEKGPFGFLHYKKDEKQEVIETRDGSDRQNSQASSSTQTAGQLPPDEWITRFRAWAESHPKREIVIDDSRETIYGGRGE